jgi:hypothetical protein
MNRIVYFAFSILIAAILLQFSSCSIDDDDNPFIDERQAFLGVWNVDESCIRLNYEVEIEAAPGSDTKVLLYNFALTGPEFEPAYGFVEGNTVILPEQIIGENWKVEGTGAMQNNRKILWDYYIEIAGDGSNCQADYEKP